MRIIICAHITEQLRYMLPAGLTSLLIRGKPILLTEAIKWAESELMGTHAHHWPLTKLLDIGGVGRTPRLSGAHGMNSTSWHYNTEFNTLHLYVCGEVVN